MTWQLKVLVAPPSTHMVAYNYLARQWWHMPPLGHLGGRGRCISEIETSLVYRVSSRTARAIQRNPVSNKTKHNTNTETKIKTKVNKSPKKKPVKIKVPFL